MRSIEVLQGWLLQEYILRTSSTTPFTMKEGLNDYPFKAVSCPTFKNA